MWCAKFIAAICLGKIDLETINRKILVTDSAGFIWSVHVFGTPSLLTVEPMDYTTAIERTLDKTADKQLLHLQTGDVQNLVEQFLH